MIRRLRVLAFCISAIYVSAIIASFISSLFLPVFEDVAGYVTETCYWTNALVGYVECESEVFVGHLRREFFNFWTMFMYLTIFQPFLGGAIYTPVIVFALGLFSIARDRGGRHGDLK
jgi:hypothetical protein